MKYELNEFQRNKVLHLVPSSKQQKVIVLKRVFKNKLDEYEKIVINKAIHVVRGHNQQEGIDYEETFAHNSGLEAIKF